MSARTIISQREHRNTWLHLTTYTHFNTLHHSFLRSRPHFTTLPFIPNQTITRWFILIQFFCVLLPLPSLDSPWLEKETAWKWPLYLPDSRLTGKKIKHKFPKRKVFPSWIISASYNDSCNVVPDSEIIYYTHFFWPPRPSFIWYAAGPVFNCFLIFISYPNFLKNILLLAYFNETR